MDRPLTVMLVAAEASGDTLGAGLARALRARLGEGVRFVGVGGPRMAEEGVTSPFDIAELSVLGLIEGLKAYPRVKRRVRDAVALAAREKPDVAVLIDSWGFTLRVAKGLREVMPDVPLIKYVGPQVWASRPGRAKTLAGTVDLLLSIHALDAPYYVPHGLKSVFVGNSALAVDFSQADGARFRARHGMGADDPVLLILPGSRPSEIRLMTPVFEEAVLRLKKDRPNLRLVLPVAETVAEGVLGRVAEWPTRVVVVQDEAEKKDAFKAATVALACSGTVSTELALAGVPMVIAYRMSELSYQILSRVMTIKHITLFNIAADRRIAPEFVQKACTPDNLAAAVAERLDDPALRTRQVEAQFAALDLMGRGGPVPSEAAADAVVAFLRERGRL